METSRIAWLAELKLCSLRRGIKLVSASSCCDVCGGAVAPVTEG